MAISEQFKSLNLNKKNTTKLCTDEVGVVKMKKNAKDQVLQLKKNLFSLLLFFGCSFGFAFQR